MPKVSDPRVLVNDAIVVLCLRDIEDHMTHHEFRVRAAARGIELDKGQCHNLLHRAMGRVWVNTFNCWMLTASGVAYRESVVEVMKMLLKFAA